MAFLFGTMKTVRAILYITVLIAFVLLFDFGFSYLSMFLVIFYNEFIVGIVFWSVIKIVICFPIIYFLIYGMHLCVVWLSKLIDKISPFRKFNSYFGGSVFAINVLYWLYKIWFGLWHIYPLQVIVTCVILSCIIIDFTIALSLGNALNNDE